MSKQKMLFSSSKIQSKFLVVYMAALILPISVIGLLLLLGETAMMRQYNQDLLDSDSQRVRAILFELTNQAYYISEDICDDENIRNLISGDYESQDDFRKDAFNISIFNSTMERSSQIESIVIYSNHPNLAPGNHFEPVTEEIASSQWYSRALNQSSVFWTIINHEDAFGNTYSYLSLVRRIPIIASDREAVVVIKLSDNYLKSRISTSEYHTILSLDKGNVFFSDDRSLYNNAPPYFIDYSDPFYSYMGLVKINDTKYLSSISCFSLYHANSTVYLCTFSLDSAQNISNLAFFYLAILSVAIILPATLMFLFIKHFSKRVEILRTRMHKASLEDYTIPLAPINRQDELDDVYKDLDILIKNIREKEALIYQSELNAKELRNEQQQIEYKMLASQINPHFLYNTLETIRMKAITAGNRDVADAVKMLGKSMRYVLENTATSSTSLQNELDYVVTYLNIQRLRFEDRVNYTLDISEDVHPESISVLSLLLQPIVENSILHGLERITENGQIHISVMLESPEILKITVSDNGHGLSPEELASLRDKLSTPGLKLQTSIGLYNIHERIRLYYGSDFGVTIDSIVNEGTSVIVRIPRITL